MTNKITGPEYSVHPGVAMASRIVDGMKEKTGRTLEAWVRILNQEGPSEKNDGAQWLKKKHRLGSNYAAFIVERAEGRFERSDPDAYLKACQSWVDAMFSGPKQALEPIYLRIVEMSRSLGDDIRICPAKTIVPVYRNHVIAQVKASTKTRIDLGLALGQKKPPKRFQNTGGHAKGDRITHRVAISGIDELDPTVSKWLKVAYRLDDPE